MRFLLTLVILSFAFTAHADFTLLCDGFYPEPDSPEHSIVVAAINQSLDGVCSVNALSCFLKAGDLPQDCTIGDGVCCPCNVSRGYTPECLAAVIFSGPSTAARCLETYPGAYYGLDSSQGAFVEAPAVVKHSRRKHAHHTK